MKGRFRLIAAAGALVVSVIAPILIFTTISRNDHSVDMALRLAEASSLSQQFLTKEVKTYRSRGYLIQGPEMLPDIRGNMGRQVNRTTHYKIETEVQMPDRAKVVISHTYVFEDNPGVHYDPRGCDTVSIWVGTTVYDQHCDGSWSTRVKEKPLALDQEPFANYWEALQRLGSVKLVGSGTADGAPVDVFAGVYVDKSGREHQVIVKVGSEDNLVRYIKDNSALSLWEWEIWDINDPSVQIEPPIS